MAVGCGTLVVAVGVALTACGSGEADTQPRSRDPMAPTAQTPAQNDFGSTARDTGGGGRWNSTTGKGKQP